MYDPEGTRRAFDEEGFYQTGDIARQEGGLYYIEGRSAIDSKLSLFVANLPKQSVITVDCSLTLLPQSSSLAATRSPPWTLKPKSRVTPRCPRRSWSASMTKNSGNG